jgi:hypothetical protein
MFRSLVALAVLPRSRLGASPPGLKVRACFWINIFATLAIVALSYPFAGWLSGNAAHP